MMAPRSAKVLKNFCGRPMPAKARTRRPRSTGAVVSGPMRARNDGEAGSRGRNPRRACRHRPDRSRPRPRRTAPGAWSGARSGPAGKDRPLPMPVSPSTAMIEQSLASDGFWKPSSMIDDVRRRRRRQPARPATRSAATTVGACAASSMASSPTLSAVAPGSTRSGPFWLPAIAARQEGGLLRRA